MQNFVETKERILQAERHILNVCEYEMVIQHPWNFFPKLVRVDSENKKRYEPVWRRARKIAISCLQEMRICLRFDPLTLGKFCLALGGTLEKLLPPNAEEPEDTEPKDVIIQKWCEYLDLPIEQFHGKIRP